METFESIVQKFRVDRNNFSYCVKRTFVCSKFTPKFLGCCLRVDSCCSLDVHSQWYPILVLWMLWWRATADSFKRFFLPPLLELCEPCDLILAMVSNILFSPPPFFLWKAVREMISNSCRTGRMRILCYHMLHGNMTAFTSGFPSPYL